MYCIYNFVLPPLARRAALLVGTGHQNRAARCFATWLLFWDPCQDPENFMVPAPGTEGVYLVTHKDICEPSYSSDSSCPRAVIEVLGTLLIGKLTFAICVGTVMLLLSMLPAVRACGESLIQKLRPTYVMSKDMDTEVAGLVMYMDLALLMGFSVPLLVPLIAILLAIHAVLFQVGLTKLDLKLKNEAYPPINYLWVSLALGWGLHVWLFFEAGWNSKWLVLFGMPAAPCIVVVVWIRRSSRRALDDEQALDTDADSSSTQDEPARVKADTYYPLSDTVSERSLSPIFLSCSSDENIEEDSDVDCVQPNCTATASTQGHVHPASSLAIEHG